jgi:hypothetical protein
MTEKKLWLENGAQKGRRVGFSTYLFRVSCPETQQERASRARLALVAFTKDWVLHFGERDV